MAKQYPTTQIGYLNRNGLTVIRNTGLPGTDHNQTIYVLRCPRGGAHEFGANGADIHLRRCPDHDGGQPGLAFD